MTLFDDTANITIPYWHHGRNGEEVLREAWSYLEVLEHDGGFRAYDPQLERLVFLRTDFSAVLAMYAQGVSFTDKMDQKDASSTPDYSPDTERRELRRLRRLTLAGQAIILAILIALLYPVVRFPAATLPAVLMALVGLYRNRSMAALPSPKGWLDRDPPAPDKLDDRFESLFGRILAWSLPGGALGYAALAAVGIGVPAPEVAVGWRVFGGLVVGAMAGVAAAWALWALPLLTRGPRAA
jgi:hypothetical protein